MGHYDDAREAHENLIETERLNKDGLRLKSKISELSDVDAGKIYEALIFLQRKSESFIGSREQIRSFDKILEQIRKII